MKLIGLFGVLLAISAVFAANPGKCAGNMPTMTVEECNDEPCTFAYALGNWYYDSLRMYLSCNNPRLKEINCKTLKTMDDCLSHSCTWVQLTQSKTSKTELKCFGPDRETARRHFKVQAPRKITAL